MASETRAGAAARMSVTLRFVVFSASIGFVVTVFSLTGLRSSTSITQLRGNGNQTLRRLGGRSSIGLQHLGAIGGLVLFYVPDKMPRKALSAARGPSLLNAVTNDYGIAASRLTVSSHGSFSPKTSNDTADGRPGNRRVEILILDRQRLRAPGMIHYGRPAKRAFPRNESALSPFPAHPL